MLTLRAGDASLVLAPEIGGAIVGWTLGARPLLRRARPEALIGGHARGLGAFPLVPYSNRIAWARFRWDDREYELDRNFGDHPHAIHGVGWQSAWTVAEVGAASARLTLHHDPAGAQARRWPFAFAAEQRVALTPEALQVALSVRNLHTAAAPAGLGLHPYFPRGAGATLRFRAASVWINGDDMLPVRREAVPAAWDHSAGRAVGSAVLDNCFAGWTGEARIDWGAGEPSLTLTADGLFRHLVVYTPSGRDYFCVEPVSNTNDAISRMAAVPDHGLRTLAPGEELRGELTFRLGSAD